LEVPCGKKNNIEKLKHIFLMWICHGLYWLDWTVNSFPTILFSILLSLMTLFLWPPSYALSKALPYQQSSSPLHPLPSTLFLFILFDKEEKPFLSWVSQSYQGARLNFKKIENNPKLLILFIFFFNYRAWTFSPRQTSTITREVSMIWSCHPQFSFWHSFNVNQIPLLSTLICPIVLKSMLVSMDLCNNYKALWNHQHKLILFIENIVKIRKLGNNM
jgi:hypothetical protein